MAKGHKSVTLRSYDVSTC